MADIAALLLYARPCSVFSGATYLGQTKMDCRWRSGYAANRLVGCVASWFALDFVNAINNSESFRNKKKIARLNYYNLLNLDLNGVVSFVDNTNIAFIKNHKIKSIPLPSVFIFEHLCTPKDKVGSKNCIFGQFLHWHNISYSEGTKPNLL